jgi:hypothetical protein
LVLVSSLFEPQYKKKQYFERFHNDFDIDAIFGINFGFKDSKFPTLLQQRKEAFAKNKMVGEPIRV